MFTFTCCLPFVVFSFIVQCIATPSESILSQEQEIIPYSSVEDSFLLETLNGIWFQYTIISLVVASIVYYRNKRKKKPLVFKFMSCCGSQIVFPIFFFFFGCFSMFKKHCSHMVFSYFFFFVYLNKNINKIFIIYIINT